MARGLTAFKVENAKANPHKRIEIADAGQRGLYLIVQPSGAKSWCVRYRHNDRPRKFTLPGFPSLATARKLAGAAVDVVANGGDPAGDKKAARLAPPPSGAMDVGRAFQLYLDKQGALRAATRYEKARLLGLKRGDDGKWMATGNGALAR